MSAPLFTPGPWHYRGTIGLLVQSEFLGRTICRLRPGLKDRGEISAAAEDGDNFDADGRLIAAAPELYEAVQVLLAAADHAGGLGGCDPELEAACAVGSAALARARGQS